MSAVPIPAAARALGVSTASLRRWIARGCPVARPGRAGRGHGAMLNVDAVKAWRAGSSPCQAAPAFQHLAVLAEVLAEAHRLAPDKRGGAWLACCAWQLFAGRMESAGVDIPEHLPDEITRLRELANIGGKT